MATNVEEIKLEIERTRIQNEHEVKKDEIKLRREELQFRIDEAKSNKTKISPIVATLVAAVCGILGTAIGAYLQGRSNIDLEVQKFQGSLILKSIETGNREEAAKNLAFFVKAGFLTDKNKAISSLAIKPEESPVLPTQRGQSALSSAIRKSKYESATVLLKDRKFFGSGVFVSSIGHILTSSDFVKGSKEIALWNIKSKHLSIELVDNQLGLALLKADLDGIPLREYIDKDEFRTPFPAVGEPVFTYTDAEWGVLRDIARGEIVKVSNDYSTVNFGTRNMSKYVGAPLFDFEGNVIGVINGFNNQKTKVIGNKLVRAFLVDIKDN